MCCASRIARDLQMQDGHIAKALESSVEVQKIIDEYDRDDFLPIDAADSLFKAVKNYLAEYSFAAHDANEAGELLFTVAPKHHMMYHWGAKAKFLHPRKSACFGDEGYVGIVKHIVRASTAGMPLHQIAATVTTKHRWGLHFLYKHGM